MAGIFQTIGEPTEIYTTPPNPFNATQLQTNMVETMDVPATDIVTKVKAFYSANPTLSLAIVGAVIYFGFIKDKK